MDNKVYCPDCGNDKITIIDVNHYACPKCGAFGFTEEDSIRLFKEEADN